MTTILVLNAVSSLLATFGIGAFVVGKHRRARSQAVVQPVYVTRPRR
jgi:hypothetical protein